MAIAIFTRGTLPGRRITITRWPATLGRDPEATIPVDDDKVSRLHAKIKKRGRLYILEDLQSKNGTWLNGDKVTNSTINSGDKILVGDTEIVFLTPETQIDLGLDLMDIDHDEFDPAAYELGGSLELGHLSEADNQLDQSSAIDHQKIFRMGSDPDIDLESIESEKIFSVFNSQSNILSSDNLKDCSANLLKAIQTLCPQVARSIFFTWTKTTRKLIPTASRLSTPEKKYNFNKRALESVIARRQGLAMMISHGSIPAVNNLQNSPALSRTPPHLIVLPVVHMSELVGIVHLEIDTIDTGGSKNTDPNSVPLFPLKSTLDAMRLLLDRVAPSVDSFILRRDLDHYSVGMIEAMIATLEAKDTYTHGHSERVSRYSLAIGDEMNLDRDVKRLLLMSSLCHDIGKIGIPDAILRKASLLNPDEYEEMKQHPVIGENIVNHLPNAKRFISGVKYHHEKWDGTGYPDGLVGEDIPFFGRIVAVADVFDAMISGRSYSGFLDESDAVDRLSQDKDLFDPDIVKAFTQAWNSGRLTQKTSTLINVPGIPKKRI